MASLRSERGQAATEYVALLGVLALLLGLAATLAASGAPAVANAVLGQMRHALCVVTGAACPAERVQPCAVATVRDERHVAVNIALVRLDDDHVVLRRRMSDGSVRLIVMKRSGAGIEGGVGGRAQITSGGRTIGFERDLRLGLSVLAGAGDVYYARDDDEADRILHELRHRGRPLVLDVVAKLLPGGADGGPRPRQVFVEGGPRALARAGAERPGVAAGLELTASRAVGARQDRQTGETTIYLSSGALASAYASAAIGMPWGALDGRATVGVTIDRDERPIDLSLLATGIVGGGARLPIALAKPLGLDTGDHAPATAAGRRWELEAHVDLRDPDVAAAWSAYRHAPTSLQALRALVDRLRARARVDVRRYRTTTASSGGAAGAGFGPNVGVEVDHTIERAQLVSARTRPPGGLWEPRFDCVSGSA